MSEVLRIRNWDTYQHYSERSMIWAKLYAKRLSDYELMRLRPSTRELSTCLICVAIETKNLVPFDRNWLKMRCGLTPKQLEVGLQELEEIGFVERIERTEDKHPASKPLSLARSRRSTRAVQIHKRDANASQRARATQADIETVNNCWRTERHRSNRRYDKLSPKRRKKIIARLEEFSVEELCTAIRGVAGDPWPERPQHDDLTIILRDREQVERFLSFAENPPVANGRRGVSAAEILAQAEASE